MIDIGHQITLSALVFVLGVAGIFINRRNIITILMSIELMLLAVSINFVSFSVYHGEISGQVFSFMILTVAAAEAAIGLAILVSFYRARGTISVDAASAMRN